MVRKMEDMGIFLYFRGEVEALFVVVVVVEYLFVRCLLVWWWWFC